MVAVESKRTSKIGLIIRIAGERVDVLYKKMKWCFQKIFLNMLKNILKYFPALLLTVEWKFAYQVKALGNICDFLSIKNLLNFFACGDV